MSKELSYAERIALLWGKVGTARAWADSFYSKGKEFYAEGRRYWDESEDICREIDSLREEAAEVLR